MTPRALQLPSDVMGGTSQRSIVAPFATSLFFNFSGVKNAIQRESGDQNGLQAPSEPGTNLDSLWSSRRTQSWALPWVRPTKESMAPSGEIAKPPPPLRSKRKLVAGGGRSEAFRAVIGMTGRSRSSVQAIAVARATPMATTPIHHQVCFGGRADSAALSCVPDDSKSRWGENPLGCSFTPRLPMNR